MNVRQSIGRAFMYLFHNANRKCLADAVCLLKHDSMFLARKKYINILVINQFLSQYHSVAHEAEVFLQVRKDSL